MEYLDFELPIKEIQEQLSKCEVIAVKVILTLLILAPNWS